MVRSALALAGLVLALTPAPASADGGRLRVAISRDIPPYVMNQATDGLEVALAGQALARYEISFVQLSYGDLETAVPQGRADVSVGVQQRRPGMSYSGPFITFVNDAISKRAAHLAIGRVADLARYRVLAWQNAWYDLGGAFGDLYRPGSPARAGYTEFADQREQVRHFWSGAADVVVIDRSVFAWLSRELGYDAGDAVAHALFAPETGFRVAFRDAAVRDEFDRGIAALCASGGYATLLARFGVVVERTVCAR